MLKENFKSKKVVQKSSSLSTGLYLIAHGAPQGRNLNRPGLPLGNLNRPELPLGNLTENINEHFLTDTSLKCPGIVGHLPQSKIQPKKRWGPRGEDFESAIILRVILGIILRIIGCPIQELCIPA